MKYRYENFGGILSIQDPPFLAFVDRDFMRELGLADSPRWEGTDESIGVLSAPTEVHFSVTNRCPARCPHCYMNAGEPDPGEMDTSELKAVLKQLGEMGVFHVALGGGEALARPDLFEIAEFARECGLVPNLTVSGELLTAELAPRMKVFGQVNVSLDGVGPLSGVFRGRETFPTADRALGLLVAAGVPTGINCVVGKGNYDGLADLFAYARAKGLNEIEFLRYKASGRAREAFLAGRATPEQNLALVPMLTQLSEKHSVRARIDCSFVPMLCAHRPPRETLEAMGTYGCEPGNVLLGIRSNGVVSGCSFLEATGLKARDLRKEWTTSPALARLRAWPERAAEPCRSCDYLRLCKGGCHAVAAFVTGDPDAPDPDCPFVVEFSRRANQA